MHGWPALDRRSALSCRSVAAMSTRAETEDRATVNLKDVVTSFWMSWPTNISIQTAGNQVAPPAPPPPICFQFRMPKKSDEKTFNRLALSIDKNTAISTPSAATAGEAAHGSEAEIVAKLEHGIQSRTGGCAGASGSPFFLLCNTLLFLMYLNRNEQHKRWEKGQRN